MSDIRARRTAVLAAAAKAKSDAKAQAADQAIRRLVRRGEPVTFQAVQREAGVSHAFLYGNPDLRGRIERLRAQARPQPVPASDANGDGCGSFEVSWLRCQDEAVAVSGVVDAFVLAAQVEAPVGVEVAAGDQGAEFQDGLGAFEPPPCARYVHSFQQCEGSWNEATRPLPGIPEVAGGIRRGIQACRTWPRVLRRTGDRGDWQPSHFLGHGWSSLTVGGPPGAGRSRLACCISSRLMARAASSSSAVWRSRSLASNSCWSSSATRVVSC